MTSTEPRGPASATEPRHTAAVDIRPHDRGFLLTTRIVLPRPLGEVFPFFADAGNLDRLTPPWLQFRILTPLPVTMRPGLRLDYRLHLRGIPIRWQSEIPVWDPPHRFVDEQKKGPYRYWIHEHRFATVDGGTEVSDEVRYAVHGGALANRLFVQGDLTSIFQYRQQKLMEIFPRRAAGGADAAQPVESNETPWTGTQP
jgi:ligand-binding SRPBCC domain-containing protein